MKRLFAFFVLICLIFSLVGCNNSTESQSTYETAVIDYMDVYRRGKTEKLEQLAPQAVIDNLKETTEFDIEKRREIIDKEYAGLEESLKQIYGKDMKFTVTVNKKETVDTDMFEIMKSQIAGFYKISEEDIKEVAIAHFTVTYSGNGKEKSSDTKMMVVNIKDNWYACNTRADFGIVNDVLYLYLN